MHQWVWKFDRLGCNSNVDQGPGRGNELQGVVGLVRRKIKGLTLIEATDLGVSDYACPVLRDDLISLLEKDKQLKDFIVH